VGRYRVLIKPSAKKELVAIPAKKDRQRIVQRVQSLAEDPRPSGCQKLSGYDRYRLRQGQNRIVFETRDNELVVVVINAGHRREAYRAR
jgi:mRNA interferase RelE/StbE